MGPTSTQKNVQFGIRQEWVCIPISPLVNCLDLDKRLNSPELCFSIYTGYKIMALRFTKYIKCLPQWLAHNKHLKMIVPFLDLLPYILDLLITVQHLRGPFSTLCPGRAAQPLCLCASTHLFCHPLGPYCVPFFPSS